MFHSGKDFIINRGVRKDDNMIVRGSDLTYVFKKRGSKGVGVMTDSVMHMISPPTKDSKHMLVYSRPCLCGSFSHSSPRSYMCFLCPKYLDAIEHH